MPRSHVHVRRAVLLALALSTACATGVDNSPETPDAGGGARPDARSTADASPAPDVAAIDVFSGGVDSSIDVALGVDSPIDAPVDATSSADVAAHPDSSASDAAYSPDANNVCQMAGSSGSSCFKGTCPGCCDTTGNCHPGTSNADCGSGNQCCSSCTSLGLTCNSGSCS